MSRAREKDGPLVGRRVATIADIERPGDYCFPVTGFSDVGEEACYFLLPNAHDEDGQPGQRSLHHVTFPPHTYRECDDGSLEIRASIGARPFWHGYLDEGHVWREC